MPDNDSHFEIPSDRVRTAPIKVRGRAKPFQRPSYSAHGDYLREQTARVREYVETAADADAAETVFLQVKTPQELPARGERQRLRNAGLDIVALSPVDPSSATVQLPRSNLSALERKIERYASSPNNRGKSYLAVIEDLQPVPVEEKLDPQLLVLSDDPVDCLLVFYSSLTEKERATVLFAVRSFMGRRGAALGQQRRLSNGVIVVEARLRPSEAREAGASFTTLKQVTPDHVFYVPDAWRISAVSSAVQVEPPRLATAVAVVDTGICGTCPGLLTAVAESRPQLPPGAVAAWPEHGTFVASRITYGDNLEQQLRSGVLRPLCPLVDVPIVGVDANGRVVATHEGHLASAIDAALPSLPRNARVVNVSLGTNVPVSDGSISLIAQLLDKHARERDLVVVTTAGNIRDPRLLSTFPAALLSPQCRIDSPGDALLAVTVGSIAKYADTGALSQPGGLSAFSRRGPGPLGGVKPDVVAHGGNCLADGTTSARIGAHGLTPGGPAWACDYGTSFAAPLVAGMAAQLFDYYTNASANLVRALLLHFTRPVPCPPVPLQPEHLVGLGEPVLEAALRPHAHAATFLYMGEIAANQFTYLPFLVPPCLAAGGQGRLRIRATVVIDPPVNPDNQLEYSKARVSLALRKPVQVGHAQVGVSEDLVESDKWWPLAQLDRPFQRSYATGEWELQLRLWTRDLPADHKQRVAVVLEVIDDSSTQPVYDEVAAQPGVAFRPIAHGAAA
jgi:hypothetical protein